MATPSGSTAEYGFPYLLETDVPDVATASQKLAQAVENLLKTMRIGQIGETFTSTPPTGAVLLQGQAVSRTVTYAALFAKWGTLFGVGNGTTTFNLPDGRQKVLGGYQASTTFGTLGATIGANTQQLAANQIPRLTVTITDPHHGHTLVDPGHEHASGAFEYAVGSATTSTHYLNTGSNQDHGTNSNITYSTHTASDTTGVSVSAHATGISAAVGTSTNAHVSTIQKTLVVNFYAYYK